MNDTHKQIKNLQDEIERLRRLLRHHVPDSIRRMLGQYESLSTHKELHAWKAAIIEAAVEIITPKLEAEHNVLHGCPLCHSRNFSGASGIETALYQFERHLEGRKWNISDCLVLEYFEQQASQLVWQREEAERDRRRRIELVIVTTPNGRPELLYEEAGFGRRRQEAMAFAEQRLQQFDFKAEKTGNRITYRRLYPDFTVFADPRDENRISFSIHTKVPRKYSWTTFVDNFYIQDRWVKNLRQRFDDNVASISQSLMDVK
jgi:hypothetical protein